MAAIDRASPPSGPTAVHGGDADWPYAAAIENKPMRRHETHLRGKQIRRNPYVRFVTKSSAKIEKISNNNEKRLTGCRSTSKYHRGIFTALSIRLQRQFEASFAGPRITFQPIRGLESPQLSSRASDDAALCALQPSPSIHPQAWFPERRS